MGKDQRWIGIHLITRKLQICCSIEQLLAISFKMRFLIKNQERERKQSVLQYERWKNLNLPFPFITSNKHLFSLYIKSPIK